MLLTSMQEAITLNLPADIRDSLEARSQIEAISSIELNSVMRIVFDTNVLIASLISRGKCYALVEHSLKVHEIISSKFILDELAEKLQKKFKYGTVWINMTEYL
jgi:predicted nucleic acid-binding protein